MEKQYRYMVKQGEDVPMLIRLDPPDYLEAYQYEIWIKYSNNQYWVHKPELDDILAHKNRFPEYTEITQEEAEEIERQIEAKYDKIEKELQIIHTEHSQKQTEDGLVEVVTYQKTNGWRDFTVAEYIEILNEYLGKKYTVFSRADYYWYDEWGYQKHWAVTRKMDIPMIIEEDPSEIVARFSDKEHKYILRAPFLLHSIELEISKKTKKTVS